MPLLGVTGHVQAQRNPDMFFPDDLLKNHVYAWCPFFKTLDIFSSFGIKARGFKCKESCHTHIKSREMGRLPRNGFRQCPKHGDSFARLKEPSGKHSAGHS